MVHQRLGEIGVDEVLRHAPKIVEIGLPAVFAEVGAGDVGIAQVRHHALDVLRAVVNHAKAPAGELRVAAALFFRGALEQANLGALLRRRQSRAQSGVSSPDHYDIITARHGAS